MHVLLKAVGNPDFGQYGEMAPTTWLEVDDLAQARKVCLGYIDAHQLGGGNWAGGEVRDDGKQVARVSYNGRVWSPDGAEITL